MAARALGIEAGSAVAETDSGVADRLLLDTDCDDRVRRTSRTPVDDHGRRGAPPARRHTATSIRQSLSRPERSVWATFCLCSDAAAVAAADPARAYEGAFHDRAHADWERSSYAKFVGTLPGLPAFACVVEALVVAFDRAFVEVGLLQRCCSSTCRPPHASQQHSFEYMQTQHLLKALEAELKKELAPPEMTVAELRAKLILAVPAIAARATKGLGGTSPPNGAKKKGGVASRMAARLTPTRRRAPRGP